MSERWIQATKKILDQLKPLDDKEMDRLELVRSLSFILNALQRSLLGWMQWTNNPNIMARFTQGDLQEMNRKMSELARSFIEYDLKATELGIRRGLKVRKKVSKKKEGNVKIFYV